MQEVDQEELPPSGVPRILHSYNLFAMERVRDLSDGFGVYHLRQRDWHWMAIRTPIGGTVAACHGRIDSMIGCRSIMNAFVGVNPTFRGRGFGLVMYDCLIELTHLPVVTSSTLTPMGRTMWERFRHSPTHILRVWLDGEFHPFPAIFDAFTRTGSRYVLTRA
jgi:hypothetical protein